MENQIWEQTIFSQTLVQRLFKRFFVLLPQYSSPIRLSMCRQHCRHACDVAHSVPPSLALRFERFTCDPRELFCSVSLSRGLPEG